MLPLNPSAYCPIPTSLVTYDHGIEFDVYMRKGHTFMLYAKHGELTENHKQRLYDHCVDTLYIHLDDIQHYDKYVESTFSGLLRDDRIDPPRRSEILYKYSTELGKILMQSEAQGLPAQGCREHLEHLISNTYEYLSCKPGAVSNIAGMLSHSHRTYTHCVNVSIYVMLMLVRLGYNRRRGTLIGMGSALHDIGKTRVPRIILDKPGRLTDEERLIIHNHPADGLDICRNMGLDKLSKDCIIHHHEKLDGSGYPARRRSIPEHVRIVTIADIYDALTSDRPYAKSCTPFQAFRILLKAADAGKLDKHICREFVKILGEDQAETN